MKKVKIRWTEKSYCETIISVEDNATDEEIEDEFYDNTPYIGGYKFETEIQSVETVSLESET